MFLEITEPTSALRELLALVADGEIGRTIHPQRTDFAKNVWLGPPNDEQYPISAGDYTAEVHDLFERGLVEGRMASNGTGVTLMLTTAGRALLDSLNHKPEGD